jgi:lambda family phage portal protein
MMAAAIGTIAPGAAISYTRKRQALSSYAAASKTGPNKAWRPSNRSADDIIKTDHKVLRARARSLVRDSSHVSGGLRKVCNNVVFKGINPQATMKDASQNTDKIRNDYAETIYKDWAQAVGLFEKLNLILRHWWQDGELFVHYFLDETLFQQGLIPLGVELMECDHLDVSRNGQSKDGSKIKQGIEYDAAGRVAAYWLYPEHPGDSTWLTMAASRRYPAQFVDHLFVRERISQNRGVPWLASVIMEMRDFSEYQSAERIAARLAAAFGIFVTTPYPEQHMTGASPIGADGQMGVDDLPDFLEPGRIQPIPPGMDIKTAANERPGRTYEPFTKTVLRGASAGFNMSYEAYSNDYTDASYASARSASLEERRGYQVQQFLLASMFLHKAWARLWDLNKLTRQHQLPQAIPVTWQMPGWPWVDPDKDSKAAERDIKNGLNSRRKVCSERGTDYDEIINDLKKEEDDGFPLGGESEGAGNEPQG